MADVLLAPILNLTLWSPFSLEDGRRPKRTRTWPDLEEPPKVATMNSDSSNLFSRLKGVVDSDESDSEEDRMKGNDSESSSSNEDGVHRDNKRRRLESTSDDEQDH